MSWPKYLRSGHTWLPWEDKKLYAFIQNRVHPSRVSAILQRTPWAIACRMEKKFNVRWNSRAWESNGYEYGWDNPLSHAHLEEACVELGNLIKERNVNDGKFWMCWVEGRPTPTVCHWSIDEAMTEAKRLTAKTGHVTHVMEVCGHFSPIVPQPPEPVWTQVRP